MKRQNISKTATSSKIKKEAASYHGECLTDVFQDEIIMAFPDITRFKKFARSGKGLCLDELVIQQIVECHEYNVVEQKLQMLQKWSEKTGEKATSEMIRLLLQRYLEGHTEDYVSLDGGRLGLYRNQPLSEQGHVYFGVQKSEITGSYFCAIKLEPKTKSNLREAQILSKLRNHVNVVSILHAGIYRSGMFDYIFIAMDLSWTKTVRNMLEESDRLGIPFNEFISTNLVRQISKAVDFIHSNNIIHRDLKPENVLVSEDWCHSKVTDFEFSKTFVSGFPTKQTSVNIGTDGYRSAETYNIEVKITSKSDIFSLGVIIAEILANGKHPFGTNQYLWSNNIIKNQNLDLRHLLVSNRAQVVGLIKRMMEMDPEKRPTAEKVQNEINQFKTWWQLKNQQTTADLSSATTSMAELSITEKANAIVMFNMKDKHMYSYKLFTKEWCRMQEFNIDSYFGTAVVSGSYIYILKHHQVYQLEYSDSTASWKRISSMVNEYHGRSPSAAMLNGLIYVCGGSDVSQSVERYDAARDRWDCICDMNIGRHHSCVVATKDHIYSIGGQDEKGEPLQSAERFDEILNKWEFVKSTPRSINEASAAVAQNRVYVADHGGILCYSIQKNSWSEINLLSQWPFTRYRNDVRILAVNEELYIIGDISESSSKTKTAIYLLEPETKQMILVEEFDDSKRMNVLACLYIS